MNRMLLAALTTASLYAPPAAQSCATISPAAAKLEFDAASVRPAGPFQPARSVGVISGGPDSKDPGRIAAVRVSLASLIFTAYGLMPDQIAGAAWTWDMIDNGFAITATMPPETTKEEYCGMLRNLLASRFHLAFHREMRSRPGYELTVLPNGPKFKKYNPDATGPDAGPGVQFDDATGFGMLSPKAATGYVMAGSPNGRRIRLTFRNSMGQFAAELGSDINRSNGIGPSEVAPIPRVADKTGLTGTYDIHLEFAGPAVGSSVSAGDPQPAADLTSDIFSAVQQQLGLKLTKVKDVSVEVLIVDHADQTPTDN